MNTVLLRIIAYVTLCGLAASFASRIHGAERPAAAIPQITDPLPPLAAARIGSSRYWHGAQVRLVAFSLDGKLLASAALADNSLGQRQRRIDRPNQSTPELVIRLWEPDTGKLVRSLTTTEIPGALAFGPEHWVAASEEGDICVWNADTGKIIRRWNAHEKRICKLSFTVAGHCLASASADGQLRIWNSETGEKLHSLTEHAGSVTSLSFSKDGTLLATAGVDGIVQIFNAETGERLGKYTPMLRPAGVAFHPNENLAAFPTNERPETNSRGISIALFDAAMGKQVRLLPTDLQGVRDLAFAAQGDRLVLEQDHGGVEVLDMTTGRVLLNQREVNHEGHFAVEPGGKYLAIGDRAWVNVVDLQSGRSLLAQSGARTGPFQLPLISPDSRLLVVRSTEGALLWDLTRQQPVTMLQAARYEANWDRGLRMSCDGRLLFGSVGRFGDGIAFWEIATGQEVRRLARLRFDGPAELNEQNTQLIAVDRRGNVNTVDAVSGKTLKTWKLPGRLPESAISPAGRWIVMTDIVDPELKVFDVASGNELWKKPIGRSMRARRIFTSQGRHLAYHNGSAIELCELESGKVAQMMKLSANVQLHDVSDDERLVCGRDDFGRIRLWEMAGGREVIRPIENTDSAGFSVLSADGRWLVTANEDQSSVVWDIPQLIAKKGTVGPIIDPVVLEPPISPLLQAANLGDLAAMRKAIDDGAKLTDADPKWGSALHLAAAQGRAPVVRELLERGADVNLPGPQGMTPLQLAVKNGRAEVVNLLLEKGALANRADGTSLLMEAARVGHTEVWKELLRRDVPLPADLGQPPLSPEARRDPTQVEKRFEQLAEAEREILSAVSTGKVERVRTILKLQPTLAVRRFSGRTLLGWAVKERQLAVVAELLAAGADIEARQREQELDEESGTVLHAATKLGDRALVEQLLKAGAQPSHDRPGMPASVLEVAASLGRVELVKVLLDQGADANGRPRVAGGPLHRAVVKNHVEIARILLEHKADPNRTSYWNPALHLAAENGSAEMIALLLKHGADPKLRGAYGLTAIQVAAFSEREPNIKILAAFELPFDIHTAAAIGDVKRLQELLAANPRAVNERLADGRTPLHVAAEKQQPEAMAALLEHGADPNARDFKLQLPLDNPFADPPFRRGAKNLIADKGGKKTPREELLKLLVDPNNARAPLYGPPIRMSGIYLYPGGRRLTANDELVMSVENVAGRRVRRVEIERDGVRLNTLDDPTAGLSLTVTTWKAGERKVVRYETWDALSLAAPEVFRAYQSQRHKIDADDVTGDNIYVGGYGRIGPLPPWPLLGVGGSPAAGGLHVEQVQGAAERAGLKIDDVLTHVGEFAVTNREELINLVGRHEVGQKVKLRYLRGNQPHETEATLDSRPESGGGIFLEDGGSVHGAITNG